MGTEYVRAEICGRKIHAGIYEGEVIGHDAWLITLCGISKKELAKLIDWLERIAEKVEGE